MRCAGGSTTTASLGCGAVFVGCGALRGESGPGGSADGVCPGATAAPRGRSPGGGAGATTPPVGGGNSCDCTPPTPGRFDGGKFIGEGSGCDGAASRPLG